MKATIIFFLGTLISVGVASPVIEGKDIGRVKQYENKDIVLNSGQFSYVVSLEIVTFEKVRKSKGSKRILDYLTCGGVIIRPNVVLTAAHCIADDDLTPEIFAWAGVVHLEKEEGKGQRIRVESYKRHKKFFAGYYNKVNYPYDIAILWLEQNFKYDGRYITQAVLPKTKLNFENKRGLVAGWGMTECGEFSDMLRKATLRAITHEQCQSYFITSKITDKQICVMSDKQNSIVSKGDSGGPFVVNGVVVGIGSHATRMVIKNKEGNEVISCNPQKPSIFTDVSSYIDWINNTLRDGPPPN